MRYRCLQKLATETPYIGVTDFNAQNTTPVSDKGQDKLMENEAGT